jgi:hypothetical protein
LPIPAADSSFLRAVLRRKFDYIAMWLIGPLCNGMPGGVLFWIAPVLAGRL